MKNERKEQENTCKEREERKEEISVGLYRNGKKRGNWEKEVKWEKRKEKGKTENYQQRKRKR